MTFENYKIQEDSITLNKKELEEITIARWLTSSSQEKVTRILISGILSI